ncbi:hypothetical protein FJY90_06860 [Candidatus Gottesmanbacteria bacterium]|nr:hypothetical protein [Candidatus Gottesmanbacteria bacterium]
MFFNRLFLESLTRLNLYDSVAEMPVPLTERGLLVNDCTNSFTAPVSLEAIKRLPPYQFATWMSKHARPADHEAATIRNNQQMEQRFFSEIRERKGFSTDVLDWVFERSTGWKLNRPEQTRVIYPQGYLSAAAIIYPPPAREEQYKPVSVSTFESNSYDGKDYDFHEGWTQEGASPLQNLIDKAKDDPDANIFGGGLPPTKLIIDFHRNIFVPAMNATLDWTDQQIEELHQYPRTGGAIRHREMVIDRFLGDQEKQIITTNFSDQKRSEGLFFTYGSQQALTYMGELLTDKYKATAENPVELAVTDPIYPGLLLALKKFLKSGILKFRVIPIDDRGNIDTVALREALGSNRCKALYLSEGNPLPLKFANLHQVADILEEKRFRKKLVFEDRAYLGLGSTEENALIHILPNRVVAFETFSKRGVPFRTGLVYSNMTPDRFAWIRSAMLDYQWNDTLGYSGLLSGSIAAILDYEQTTGVLKIFTRKHIDEAKQHYEEQRVLYLEAYEEALDLAFGEEQYNIMDKVIVGNQMFMFGWRKTPIPANKYVRAGMEMKLYSLSGSNCTPKRNQIAGPFNPRSPSNFRLRQNYTWMPPVSLRIGVFKDVLLEVVATKMPQAKKIEAIERLKKRITQLNGDSPRPEVEAFIQKVKENNWKLPASDS